MKKLVTIAVCLAFAGPALAETVSEKTGLNSLVGASSNTQDFITEAAISDIFETQSSKLVQEKKITKADEFARKMIADHTTSSEAIKSMVQGGKVKANIPTSLDNKHQSMLDKIKGLNGDDFEKQYRSDQISGHKNTVDLYKRYAKGGDNADLKAFTEKILPIVEHHQKMAEDLAK
jgi:putative membrane protein